MSFNTLAPLRYRFPLGKDHFRKSKKNKDQVKLGLYLVRETGLPPVAALADKQSTGLFGPSARYASRGQIADAIFSLLQAPSPLQNKKSKPIGLLFLLVRETGLEPVHQRYTPLKRARLPIPPLPRGTLLIIHERVSKVKGFFEKIFYFLKNSFFYSKSAKTTS